MGKIKEIKVSKKQQTCNEPFKPKDEIQTQSVIEEPKKRGRPRKKTNSVNTKNRDSSFFDNSDEEIIIQLPVFDKEKEVDTEVNTVSDMICSESSDLYMTEEVSSKKLIYKNRKQELIINELKKTILQLSDNSHRSNAIPATKENIKILHDLGLININGKKICVQKTDICCWWCTCQFDTLPCFLPERYQNGVYYVFGCFCSGNCSKSYNIKLNDFNTSQRNILLNKMWFAITGIMQEIIPAPMQIEILDKFGGPTTIHEFRDSNIVCKKNMIMNIPPILSLALEIEETKRDYANEVDY